MSSPITAVPFSREVLLWGAVASFILLLALPSARSPAAVPEAPAQALSEAGQNADVPQVAVDDSGRATITWRRSDGLNQRIQAVRLDANGTPEAIQTLSGAGRDANRPQVAIDSVGRATVVWQRRDESDDLRIQAVRIGADGTPGTVHTLSDAGENAGEPQVAIDGSGRATVVWRRLDGLFFRIQSVRLGADGMPGAVQTLSEGGRNAEAQQVTVDGSSRATVTWRRFDNEEACWRVQSVRIDANGTPGPVQTLSDAGQCAFDPQVAADGSDRVTVTWSRLVGPVRRIQSVRIDANGTPGPVQNLSEDGRSAFDPQVAIDGSGQATITWSRFDGSFFRVQSVRLSPDGIPGPVQTLSEDGGSAAAPQLAVDGAGRVTVTWSRGDGSSTRIQAVRLGAEGTPGPVQTLSEGGQNAESPQIGTDATGRPTVTWLLFDGANWRVQAVRLRGDEPTPPVVRRARIGRVKIVGPRTARLGRVVTYLVRITNAGNAAAGGVRLRIFGRGISVSASVGRIAGGKARAVRVTVRPRRAGRIRASFSVTSQNAGGRSATRLITVRR